MGLLGLRVVHLELAAALIDRERLGRRMIRSRLTPRLCLVLTDSRRGPDATLTVHGEAMCSCLAVPDHFVAPVRGGLRWRRIGRTGRLRVTDRQLHLGHG